MQQDKVRKYDVLLDGGYFSDLVFTGLPEFPRLGHEVYSRDFNLVPGGALNCAVALQRLGLKTIWPCRFGSDPFSRLAKQAALAEGLDGDFFTDSEQPCMRITVSFSFDDERAFLTYSDPLPEFPLVELVREHEPAWLCISKLSFGGLYTELFKAARKAGTRIYMDCQAHDHRLDEQEIKAALEMVDIFAPNREEAFKITGQDNLDNALEALARVVPLVVIKLGEEGCVSRQGNEVLRVPGFPMQAVDTTGAGDNFNSGFLYGRIRGFSLPDTLRIANICGGISTQGYGGTSTSPTASQVEHFLDVL
jgi:hypothetical protein